MNQLITNQALAEALFKLRGTEEMYTHFHMSKIAYKIKVQY